MSRRPESIKVFALQAELKRKVVKIPDFIGGPITDSGHDIATND